jgi:tRNA(Arg) A34 adenosine deaminase TadA
MNVKILIAWAGVSSVCHSLLPGAGSPGTRELHKPAQAVTPTEADLAKIAQDKVQLIDRLLTVVEKEIVPLTQQGVREGNKLFGGAVLKKSDLSTVVAVTNAETGNPLLHGEITAINAFYNVPRGQRPPAKDCVFLCTHEPCPLCLSGITWAGFDNFFYLFSYEDTKNAFNIPHDLKMLEEVFRCPDGSYAQKNHYWAGCRTAWVEDTASTRFR